MCLHRSISTAIATLALSLAAHASTINFSTALPTGHLNQSVTVGGITVSGWAVSKTDDNSWISSNVILNNRRDGIDDSGLGVCTNRYNCPTTGNGDINEIDNNGSTFEVIRLDFGQVTDVASIGLSSLDSGLKDAFAIFGSNSARPDLSLLTPLAEGSNLSEGSINPIISLNDSFRYFFVTSELRSTCDSDSDFLLKSVTTTATPEPLSEALVGTGLIGLVLISRLRNRIRGKK